MTARTVHELLQPRSALAALPIVLAAADGTAGPSEAFVQAAALVVLGLGAAAAGFFLVRPMARRRSARRRARESGERLKQD